MRRVPRRADADRPSSPGPADRTALRRYTRWLPLVVLVGICIAWWSPLGVIAALVGAMVVGEALARLDLTGDVVAVGGARLHSQRLYPFAARVPEGDRLLHVGEIGMGGPSLSTQMLRDGAIVSGIACSGSDDARADWRDLAGTPLRVANAYVDRSEAVVAYDERDHVVMHLTGVAPHAFWHGLDERRRQHGDAAAAAWVRTLATGAVALRPFQGLWLEPDQHARMAPWVPLQRRVLVDGRELCARLLLPDDLRRASPSDLFTHARPCALSLDGVASGRHVYSLDEVIASPRGLCVAVAGIRLGEHHQPLEPLWLVHFRGRWQALAADVFVDVGGRQRRSAALRVVAADDTGRLTLLAYERGYIGDGAPPRPLGDDYGHVELIVEWRQTVLSVSHSNGRLSVRLPRR